MSLEGIQSLGAQQNWDGWSNGGFLNRSEKWLTLDVEEAAGVTIWQPKKESKKSEGTQRAVPDMKSPN